MKMPIRQTNVDRQKRDDGIAIEVTTVVKIDTHEKVEEIPWVEVEEILRVEMRQKVPPTETGIVNKK